MTAQHTPGPWFIWQELAMRNEGLEPDEIEFELLEQADHCVYAGNPLECTRGRLKGHTSHICNVDVDDCDFDDDEEVCRATALANARLIAAAAEAAGGAKRDRQLLGSVVPNECVNEMHIKARAAITKATGETK